MCFVLNRLIKLLLHSMCVLTCWLKSHLSPPHPPCVFIVTTIGSRNCITPWELSHGIFLLRCVCCMKQKQHHYTSLSVYSFTYGRWNMCEPDKVQFGAVTFEVACKISGGVTALPPGDARNAEKCWTKWENSCKPFERVFFPALFTS